MMLKVTLRNLAAHKIRLLLTAVSVILGVAFVAGTLIFTDTMERQFDKLFSNISQDIAVDVRAKRDPDFVDDGTGPAVPVPASLIDTLQRVDGVHSAFGNVVGYTALVGKDGKVLSTNGAPAVGFNWVDGDFDLTEGRKPQAPGEVALDTKTAERAGFRIGDRVRLVVRNHPTQQATVVGLLDAGHLMGASAIAFDTATAQRLLLKPGYFSDIAVRSDGVDENTLRDRVAAVLPPQFEAITGTEMREEAESDVAAILGFFQTFLLVFALISIFVGAFIIFNTFSMLVAQRTRELALLRAIGAARGQVTRAVLGEAVAVGLVGSTLGLAAGAGLAVLLRELVGIDVENGLVFGPTPVIWSYAVGVGVTVISAYFPARRAAKVPPVAAMRDDVALPQRSLRIRLAIGGLLTAVGAALMVLGLVGVELGGNVMIPVGFGAFAVFLGVAMLAPVISGPVVRVLGAAYPRLFGAPGRMAQRNALRNPRRTAATAAALMIGLALVTVVNVLGASMRSSVDRAIDTQLGADYLVSAQGGQAGVDATAIEAVRSVPGVEQALPVYIGQGRFDGKKGAYVAADEATVKAGTTVKLRSGTTAMGEDGMLISTDEAEAKGWKVGTVVQVRFSDREQERLRVVGVYAKNDFLGARVLPTAAYKAHESAPPFMLVVNTARSDAATAQALRRALADHPALQVQDRAEVKKEASAQIDGLVGFLTVLLTMSIIIAAVGVINTLALSVIERTREIGLLRAVGLSRRQLRRMIRLESIVIAVFGALLGIAIGVVFGAAIQNALADEGLTVLHIPVGTLVVYLVVAAVIGVLAAVWPAWRAARMDILKAIATE